MRASLALALLAACGGTEDLPCALDAECGDGARCVESACVPCGAERCGAPTIDRALELSLDFEESTGALVFDASSHGRTGTLEGGARVAAGGHTGSALWLDGDPMSRASFGDVLPLTTDLTLELWVKLEGEQLEYPAFVANWAEGSGYWLGGSRTSTTFSWWAGWEHVEAGRLVPDVWFHVAARYELSARRISLFIDGAEAASRVLTGDVGPGPRSFAVGRSVSDNAPNGAIDELRAWSEARAAAELCADAGYRFTEGRCE